MNLKDCINIIKNCTMLACEYHIKDKCDYGYEVRENRFECAKEQAIKALEKQIPKKPFQPFGTHSYKCSNCWKFVAHEVDDDCDLTYLAEWCPYCGQRLDWNLDS